MSNDRPRSAAPADPRRRFASLIRDGRLGLEPRLTQEELAEKLGRAQASVSAWESGKQIPAVPVLYALSRELGIDAEVLLEAAGAAATAEALTA